MNEAEEVERIPYEEAEAGGGAGAFAKAFDAQLQLDQARAFLDDWGYVVLSGVFGAEACAATRGAMWDMVEAGSPGLNRALPGTWDKFAATGKYGLGSRGPCFHRQLVSNRQSPVLVRALAALVGTEPDDVIVSHDRYTVYRATAFGEAFATGDRNVHLDLNPFWHLESFSDVTVGLESLKYGDAQDLIKENNLVVESAGRHVQCVLNFSDNLEDDGGTIIVPRFHRRYKQWCARNERLRRPLPWLQFEGAATIDSPERDRLLAQAQRVPMREGSVLLWHQTMMHGSQPNRSSACRHAQFLKAYSRRRGFRADLCSAQQIPPTAPPQVYSSARLLRRAALVERCLAEAGCAHEVTELGRRVFGLDVLQTSR